MRIQSRTLMALLGSIMLACAPADDDMQGRAGTDTAAAAPTAPPPAAVPADNSANTVQVTLDEWTIVVAQDSITAGQVRFLVRNGGEYEHAFEVEGSGIEQKTQPIAPGGTTTLAVDLKPGSYELYCPIDDTHGNHEARGMRTTLVVR